MSNANKDKGSRFETECVQYLRANGYPQAARTLAGGREDRGDIGSVPFVVQCKNQREFRLSEWLREAGEQANNAGLVNRLLIIKPPRVTDPAEFYAVMPLHQAIALLREDV